MDGNFGKQQVSVEYASVIQKGKDIELNQCMKINCCEGKVHCPLCPEEILPSNSFEIISHHLADSHIAGGLQLGNYLTLPCNLPCNTNRTSCHYHCPLCGIDYVGKSRINKHFKSCTNGRTIVSDNFWEIVVNDSNVSDDILTEIESSSIISSESSHSNHLSIVRNLTDVNIRQCQECCSLFHCPFCPSECFSPTFPSKLARHLIISHWSKRVTINNIHILKCTMKNCLRNPGRVGQSHYHCPFCRKLMLTKSRLQKHIECHENGTVKRDRVWSSNSDFNNDNYNESFNSQNASNPIDICLPDSELDNTQNVEYHIDDSHSNIQTIANQRENEVEINESNIDILEINEIELNDIVQSKENEANVPEASSIMNGNVIQMLNTSQLENLVKDNYEIVVLKSDIIEQVDDFEDQDKSIISDTGSQNKISESSRMKDDRNDIDIECEISHLFSVMKQFNFSNDDIFESVGAVINQHIMSIREIPNSSDIIKDLLKKTLNVTCLELPDKKNALYGKWSEILLAHEVLEEMKKSMPVTIQDINQCFSKYSKEDDKCVKIKNVANICEPMTDCGMEKNVNTIDEALTIDDSTSIREKADIENSSEELNTNGKRILSNDNSENPIPKRKFHGHQNNLSDPAKNKLGDHSSLKDYHLEAHQNEDKSAITDDLLIAETDDEDGETYPCEDITTEDSWDIKIQYNPLTTKQSQSDSDSLPSVIPDKKIGESSHESFDMDTAQQIERTCNKHLCKGPVTEALSNFINPLEKTCTICKTIFASRPEFLYHLLNDDKCKKFKMRDFSAKIKEVITRMNRVKKPVCPYCEQHFQHLHDAKVHAALRICKSKKCDDSISYYIRCAETGRYKCNEPGCTFERNNANSIILHKKNVHFTNLKQCDVCGKAFGSEILLKKHSKSVHGPKEKEVCHICGKHILKEYMKKHVNEVHLKIGKSRKLAEPVHCEYQGCTYSCYYNDVLMKHVKRIHGVKDKECVICGAMFAYVGDLNAHHKIHRNDPERQEVKCDQCGKVMMKKNLQIHINAVHQNKRDFPCPQCNKCFSTKYILTCHLETHKKPSERIYKFICNYCGAGFINKSIFNDHLNTHTGNRPYKCPTCDKTFKQMPVFHKHLEVHSNIKYFCSICNEIFESKNAYAAHKQSLHSGTYLPCFCKDVFPNLASLHHHQSVCEAAQAHILASSMSNPNKLLVVNNVVENQQNKLGDQDGNVENENVNELLYGVKEEDIGDPATIEGPTIVTLEDGSLVLLEDNINEIVAKSEIQEKVDLPHQTLLMNGPVGSSNLFITQPTPGGVETDTDNAINQSDCYQCGYCQTLLTSFEEVQRHIISDHSEILRDKNNTTTTNV